MPSSQSRPRPSGCWRMPTSRRSPRSPLWSGRPDAERMAAEAHDLTLTYPGGLRARWRWAGSGQAAEVFALTEAGGELVDHGLLVASDPDARCRAELRIDGPAGAWTARFASTINDEPAAVLWDTPGQ